MSSAVRASGRSNNELPACQYQHQIQVIHNSYEDGGTGADSCTGENMPYLAAAAFFLGVCGDSKPNLPFGLLFAKDVRLCVEPFELV